MDPVAYVFYISQYHGASVPQESWDAAERGARGILERYKRIYTVSAPGPRSMEMAVCALAELVYRYDQEDQAASVASASIGSVHVSYAQPDQDRKARRGRELFEAAAMYADIYRG